MNPENETLTQTLIALRDLDPARELDDRLDPDSPAGRWAFEALLSEIDEGAVTGDASRPKRRLRLGLAAAGAAALALGVLLVVGLNSDDRTVGITEADAALRQLSLAAGAAERREQLPESGEYFYRRWTGYGDYEQWLALDGSGGFRSSATEGEIEMTEPDSELISVGPDQAISYREFLELPRDPDQLYEYFVDHADFPVPPGTSDFEAAQIAQESKSTPLNQRMFFTIEDIFVQAPVPPDLRVALFEVLQRIDGIRLIGETRTETGEQGIALGMYRGVSGPNDPDAPIAVDGTPVTTREDVIFDERTGELIGYRSGNPGSLEGAAVVETGIVDDVGDLP